MTKLSKTLISLSFSFFSILYYKFLHNNIKGKHIHYSKLFFYKKNQSKVQNNVEASSNGWLIVQAIEHK